jgi:formylglycine-generating enzyme required for sulfatase activity
MKYALVLILTLLSFTAARADKIAIAVLDIEAKDGDKELAMRMTEKVRDVFRKQSDFLLVNPKKIRERLAKEHADYLTSYSEDIYSVALLGKTARVKKVVVGSVSKMDQQYIIFLRVIDVEKREVVCSEREEATGSAENNLAATSQLAKRIKAYLLGASEPPPALIFVGNNDKGYKEYRNEKDSSVLIEIPAGYFMMGTREEGWPFDKPARRVYLDKYYMGKYFITVGQFKRFADATGYKTDAEKSGGAMIDIGDMYSTKKNDVSWRNPYYPQIDSHPAVVISWNDAQDYCKWAGLRLPSEAEWEKAARGTDGQKYPWGNEDPGPRGRPFANCDLHRPGVIDIEERKDTTDRQIRAVGYYSLGRSPYGCFEMASTIRQWCKDWYEENYYKTASVFNPIGPISGKYRVNRGSCSIVTRYYLNTDGRYVNTGFRVAK